MGGFDDLPQIQPVLLRPSFHRPGILTILAQWAYCEWLLEDSASRIAIPALALEMAAHLIREIEPRKPGCLLRDCGRRASGSMTVSPICRPWLNLRKSVASIGLTLSVTFAATTV